MLKAFWGWLSPRPSFVLVQGVAPPPPVGNQVVAGAGNNVVAGAGNNVKAG